MLDLEACWTAVENRDATADGNFYYGTRTTGVYCRPGCASRRPLRTNTVFFETTVAAEAAGFRREALLRGWERIDGEQRDVECFALLREDWVADQAAGAGEARTG